MAARLLDRTLLERVGGKAVEMCCPSTFISWLSHLIRSGKAPGQDTFEASLRWALVKILQCLNRHSTYTCTIFPSNKFVNAGACVLWEISLSKYDSTLRHYHNSYIPMYSKLRTSLTWASPYTGEICPLEKLYYSVLCSIAQELDLAHAWLGS